MLKFPLHLLPILALLGGCERAAFAIANLPAHLGPASVVRDISYGPQPWQKLDIYQPATAGDQPRGTVVFFYGGRWTTGARADYGFAGEAFARRGFNAVIP